MSKQIIQHLLRYVISLLLPLLVIGCGESKHERLMTPQELYGDLFYNVMSCDSLFGEGRFFVDEKDFLDCEPKKDVTEIRKLYRAAGQPREAEALKQFILTHFHLPNADYPYRPDSTGISEHIDILWGQLTRFPGHVKSHGTLINLEYPYVVPGGRFRELYYWDSYFTMLGLLSDGHTGPAQDMLDNFASLIKRYGFIPNGTRTYQSSRSQPPFFSHMVQALSSALRDTTMTIAYLEELQAEYDFWMRGEVSLSKQHKAVLRTVLMPDGEVLNRYYDSKNTPREESYRSDKQIARDWLKEHPKQNPKELYRNLRATVETGWNYSSRWLKDPTRITTVHTTDIIPVDLNCLLYHLETTLAQGYEQREFPIRAQQMTDKAEKRKAAILKYCWDGRLGYFRDYDWLAQRQTPAISAAGMFPLYVGIATRQQAERAAATLKSRLLKAHGVAATTMYSGLKWDAPSGWAPMQWIAFVGLKRYGFNATAQEICCRWSQLCEKTYYDTYKMYDRYNVVDGSKVNGEYPHQDGFGWTNAVYKLFWHHRHNPHACPFTVHYVRKTGR